MEREKRRSIEKGFVISVYWCCAVSMATGTKACGWPLMANCILHSSFVNCCLPSSHFLLGHGTKPRTGGIRNGTSAPPMHGQALSTSFAPSLSFSLLLSLSLSFFLYLSVPIGPRLLLSSPHRVHSHDLAESFSLSLSSLIWGLHFFSHISLTCCGLVFLPVASVTASVIHTDANRTSLLYKTSTLTQIHLKMDLSVTVLDSHC